MAKSFAGLKSFGSKAVSVIASGALALSLTPAIALASPGTGDLQARSTNLLAQSDEQPQAYKYDNASGKSITFNGTDSITASLSAAEKQYAAKLVSQGGNKYVYEGIAHSDNGSHYKSYSLYTAITTDSAGVITAIDLYSGNDTYAGAWGYAGGKSPAPIEGYLPDGVTFTAEKQAATGDAEVYKPTLGGKASEYGFSVSAITLMKVGADGKLAKVGTTTTTDSKNASTSTDLYERSVDVPSATSGGSGGGGGRGGNSGSTTTTAWESDAPSGTWDATMGTLSAENANLAKITYYIGDEKMPFNTYFSMGDDAAYANAYMNSIAKTTWQSVPAEGYDTNRDRWTHIMGTVALRELASWNAAMIDSKASTGLDGEIAALDTVSGATKTSTPFVGALNLAKATGKVKGVAEDVALTIDKSTSLPTVDVSGNSKDRSTAVANSDGTYTLNVVFPYQDANKRNDRYGIELLDVQVYALGNQNVGTQGMMQLAKQSTPAEDASDSDVAYTALKTYSPESEQLNATTSNDKTTYSWYPADTAAGKYVTAIDDANIEFEYEVSDYPLKVTTKNKNITHVVMRYEIGHGKIAIAYDLANMAKVAGVSSQLAAASSANPTGVAAARAAYEALPYDVRPFTTGLANLKSQEAKVAADDAAAAEAAAAAAKVVNSGDVKTVSGQTYKVTKVATASANGAVTFTKAKNAKSVTVPATVTLNDGLAYKVTQVAASSFTASKIRSVTVGSNVTKIAAKAFKGSKATKLTVKSTSLKKAGVKNCFKGASKMKAVKVPKKKLTAYKKIFTKKITGSSKALKVTK